jgi:hypothetical protein
MAIVVLVLWLFTAGAGLYLLLSSSLGRARPAGAAAPSSRPAPSPQPASVTQPAAPVTAPPPAQAQASQATPSRRAARRASRERWDPPSLVAARQAPILPGARSLVEFAHPAGGLIGLGFWLGFTLVRNPILGWIAFGLVAATACVGLAWFTANARAARRADPARSAPSFAGRLVALHGSAAALTVALVALTALVIRG